MKETGWREPHKLPLAVLWTEAEIVRQREADRLANVATVMHAVEASVQVKGGHKHLEKVLKELRDGR